MFWRIYPCLPFKLIVIRVGGIDALTCCSEVFVAARYSFGCACSCFTIGPVSACELALESFCGSVFNGDPLFAGSSLPWDSSSYTVGSTPLMKW